MSIAANIMKFLTQHLEGRRIVVSRRARPPSEAISLLGPGQNQGQVDNSQANGCVCVCVYARARVPVRETVPADNKF